MGSHVQRKGTVLVTTGERTARKVANEAAHAKLMLESERGEMNESGTAQGDMRARSRPGPVRVR